MIKTNRRSLRPKNKYQKQTKQTTTIGESGKHNTCGHVNHVRVYIEEEGPMVFVMDHGHIM